MDKFDWDQLLADCVDFTQRLIQTPSMSREEGDIAEQVAAEMRRLQFSDIEIDGIGNVNENACTCEYVEDDYYGDEWKCACDGDEVCSLHYTAMDG